ncbi:hypothetical protein [Companilactobacillus baiquanensis]|uniref:Uncharacterized protein n=1 Tax=Companilactobacillus baiquanensis TaxID=2486005 RepID=A0ABW1UYC9_9LACO|nr:hypothetical protein [Companilactobacillus baiquanensis]
MKQIDLDNSYLYDEERYRAVNSYGSAPTLNEDYFTVDGEIIRDYKNETLDPYSSVQEFDGYYFDYGDTDSFISWLLDKHIYGVTELFNAMTRQGQHEFLLNGFKQVSNDFDDMLQFEDVERS